MRAKSVLSESVMGVGVIPNHFAPAVLSFCFCGLLRKEDAKEVGIWNAALPALFCMAREDGVLIFVARAGSNEALCLVRMDICLLYLAASDASARFRNSETLTSAMPRRDFVSRRMGAV